MKRRTTPSAPSGALAKPLSAASSGENGGSNVYAPLVASGVASEAKTSEPGRWAFQRRATASRAWSSAGADGAVITRSKATTRAPLRSRKSARSAT